MLRRVSDEAQGAYYAGGLFAGQIATGTTAAPTSVAPAENAYVYEAPVTFSWTPVAEATGYVLEISPRAELALLDLETVTGTTATLPASRFAANRTDAQFWRVRSVRNGLAGPPSTARGVRVYRYTPSALQLASGARAYVETTAPSGAPACDGPSDPDEGCAEVGGDLVYESLSSTGAFRLVSADVSRLAGRVQPARLQIRFTARGSYAYSGITAPGTRTTCFASVRGLGHRPVDAGRRERPRR